MDVETSLRGGAYVVAFSGHMDLGESGDKKVREYTRDLVRQISSAREVIAVCMLAPGTDRAFAAGAVEGGARLCVVVPFGGYVDEYADDPSFASVFAKAYSTINVVDFDVVSAGRPAAYSRANSLMVAISDMLLVAYDGRPKTVGSAAEAIEFAGLVDPSIEIVNILDAGEGGSE